MKPLVRYCLPLGLSLSLVGCGIEVGNPSEPVPVPTKAELDKDSILQLAATQIDESVTAALESFEGANAAALQLKRAGLGRRGSCSPTETGLRLTYADDFEDNNQRGSASKRLAVKEKSQRSLAADVASASALSCPSGAGSKLRFDWSSLNQLTITAKAERERLRDVSLEQEPKNLLRSSRLKTNSEKQLSITKKDQIGGEYRLQKVLRLTAESELEQTQNSQKASYQMRTFTPEGTGLEIAEQLGLNGMRTAFTLVSGSLITERADQFRVKLSYQNLEFSTADSCYPSAGSIEGLVFADGISQTASSRFQIIFSDQALLRYEDGSEAELVLEACQLNPH